MYRCTLAHRSFHGVGNPSAGFLLGKHESVCVNSRRLSVSPTSPYNSPQQDSKCKCICLIGVFLSTLIVRRCKLTDCHGIFITGHSYWTFVRTCPTCICLYNTQHTAVQCIFIDMSLHPHSNLCLLSNCRTTEHPNMVIQYLRPQQGTRYWTTSVTLPAPPVPL